SAGPCLIRGTSRQPAVGIMRFDEADMAMLVNNGTLREVILHEMLHVIGIGTMWRDTAAVMRALYSGNDDPGFLGESAMRECRAEHGGNTTCAARVPIEDCIGLNNCGGGTIYGHWRELVFETELMT